MSRTSRWAAVGFGTALWLMGPRAQAHVGFDGLEREMSFVAGSTVELQWEDIVPHDTIAYHLEFIPSAGANPVPIASNLAPTVHSYTWQVPMQLCSDCALHVIQDNTGADYSATLPIRIVDENASTATDAGVMITLSPDSQSDSDNSGAEGCSVASVGLRLRGSSSSERGSLVLGWLLAMTLVFVRRSRDKN